MKRHFRDENGIIERQEFFEPDEDLQFENSIDENEFQCYFERMYVVPMFRAIKGLYGED